MDRETADDVIGELRWTVSPPWDRGTSLHGTSRITGDLIETVTPFVDLLGGRKNPWIERALGLLGAQSEDPYFYRVPLSERFRFKLGSSRTTTREKMRGAILGVESAPDGGSDMEWFQMGSDGRARSKRGGEVELTLRQTAAGWEISETRLATDLRFRIAAERTGCLLFGLPLVAKPVWQLTLHKDSYVRWQAVPGAGTDASPG